MTILSKIDKPTRKEFLRLIASGVQLHLPSGQKVLAGQTFDLPSDVVNLIQADIDATDAADKAHAEWLVAVEVQRDAHRKVGPVIRALKRLVLAQFGDTQEASSVLADFGLSPLKVAAPSAETKADAVKKGRATREARHTMGKNQKKKVKGTIDTTAPSPAAPASLPAPVTAAPVASAPAGVATAGAAPRAS